MSRILSPIADDRRLALELRLVTATGKEDALQEAWMAQRPLASADQAP